MCTQTKLFKKPLIQKRFCLKSFSKRLTDEKYEKTEKIIEAAYKVHNTLGSGFLESVYQNSFTIERRSKKPMAAYYHDEVVGNYFADIIPNGKVLLEIKAVKELSQSNRYRSRSSDRLW